MSNQPSEPRRIKSYVLRAGRMSDAQRRSYDNVSSRYCLSFEKSLLQYAQVFGADKPLIIEIGFGMGTATAQIAQANPDRNYLGIEVHRPGIGRLLWEIENRNLNNIRIIEHDGVEVLETMIPDHSVEGIHVFFPDPWTKKRHHKRRLMTRPFTDMLAAKLRPSGYVYMVTDWADYGDWALAELSATPGLINCYEDFAEPQRWRPRTKFEQKGLDKNHHVYELFFVSQNIS
ncbi:MAG: tRNA (guanosine(46)-N7)-methyltransferase TrmB [Treponema sp.]|jgi:tRNA (guanine-N7-)-methyltransferase|nr:tRNA (guanosine(46)-N7)-methyltransferase TrmB [Treponema sp.]